jgi:hypothetical protein
VRCSRQRSCTVSLKHTHLHTSVRPVIVVVPKSGGSGERTATVGAQTHPSDGSRADPCDER